MLCHSDGNRELQFRRDLVGEVWDDHERWCLFSARNSASVWHGHDHSDLDGRHDQIWPDECRDNAGPNDYVSERRVQPDQPAGTPDDHNQPMHSHCDGNGELQFRCDLVGELRDNHNRRCLYSACHCSNTSHGNHYSDLDGRWN